MSHIPGELDNDKTIKGDNDRRLKLFIVKANSYEGLKENKEHDNGINCIINLVEI